MSINEDPGTWNLATVGGIPYKLVSSSGSFSEEEALVTEEYIIEAANLLSFATESFPAPYVSLNTLFFPPRRAFPGLSSLFSKRVSWRANVDGKPVDPFGYHFGAPADTYDGFLRVTVEYGTWSPDSVNTDSAIGFLQISADAAGGFLYSNAPGTEKWETLGDEDDEVREANVPFTVRESLIEWTVRWSQIPSSFFDAILINKLRDNIGNVNSFVMPLFNNAPVDTILFSSYSIRQQFTWRTGFIGAPPIQLEMKFEEKNFTSSEGRSVTHQHFWRPGVGFRKLQVNGFDALASSNLNLLFDPSA